MCVLSFHPRAEGWLICLRLLFGSKSVCALTALSFFWCENSQSLAILLSVLDFWPAELFYSRFEDVF